jgi:thiol-disulfide isomerase/thioredoxin
VDPETAGQRRLLIGVAATLALASGILLVLSARGAFVAAISAPRIIAMSLIGLSLGALPIRRRSAPVVRATLAVIGVGLAIGAVVTHNRVLTKRRDAVEQPAKQALLGRRVSSLQWSHSFNMPAEGSQLPAAGHVTLIDFWATWCSPCRLHMPKLEELYRQRRSQALNVIGVTTFYGHDRSPEGRRAELQEIEAFLRLHHISYPVVVADDEANHGAFHISALPASVVVDRRGVILDYGTGIEGSEAVSARAIALLEGR